MKIIMLGAPGAGKGTQAARIAEKQNIPHISTGDIFRANIKNGTELGKKAKQYMDEGQLVPDSLTVELLLDRVKNDDCKNGYVLDGFPRTIPQAEALEDALSKLGESIDRAINVDVPDEAIVVRTQVLPELWKGLSCKIYTSEERRGLRQLWRQSGPPRRRQGGNRSEKAYRLS